MIVDAEGVPVPIIDATTDADRWKVNVRAPRVHSCTWLCTADTLMIVDPQLFGLFSCFIHVSLFGVLEITSLRWVCNSLF